MDAPVLSRHAPANPTGMHGPNLASNAAVDHLQARVQHLLDKDTQNLAFSISCGSYAAVMRRLRAQRNLLWLDKALGQ